MMVRTEEFTALKIAVMVLGERADLTETEVKALVRAEMAIGKAEERIEDYNRKQAALMRRRREKANGSKSK